MDGKNVSDGSCEEETFNMHEKTDHFLNNLDQMWQKGILCDLVLTVDKTIFRVHKVCLWLAKYCKIYSHFYLRLYWVPTATTSDKCFQTHQQTSKQKFLFLELKAVSSNNFWEQFTSRA